MKDSRLGLDLDTACEKAKSIAADANTNLSNIVTEEDAKIQIINRIVTECLGWKLADIRTESKHDNGFSDYILSDGNQPALLIEAKRVGKIEVQAQEKSKLRHLNISGPALKAKATILGIDQAASYAMPNGLPMAVLTDGIAWIVFKPFVPGENFRLKEAFVFPSLEAVVNSFTHFFDLLAKPQYRKRIYASMFDELHNQRLLLQQSLISPIAESEIKIERKSDISFNLNRLFDVFFSKLTREQDEEMIVECFVETRESRIADFALEKITASVLGNLAPANRDVD